MCMTGDSEYLNRLSSPPPESPSLLQWLLNAQSNGGGNKPVALSDLPPMPEWPIRLRRDPVPEGPILCNPDPERDKPDTRYGQTYLVPRGPAGFSVFTNPPDRAYRPLGGIPINSRSSEPERPNNKVDIPKDSSGKNPLLQLTHYIEPLRWEHYDEVNALLAQCAKTNDSQAYAEMAGAFASGYGESGFNPAKMIRNMLRWMPVAPIAMSDQEDYIRDSVRRNMNKENPFPIAEFDNLTSEQQKLMLKQKNELMLVFRYEKEKTNKTDNIENNYSIGM